MRRGTEHAAAAVFAARSRPSRSDAHAGVTPSCQYPSPFMMPASQDKGMKVHTVRSEANQTLEREVIEPDGCPAQVSAFVTAAQVKFLLLHDGRSDDSVKGFFKEVYDGYLRVHSSLWKPSECPDECCAHMETKQHHGQQMLCTCV